MESYLDKTLLIKITLLPNWRVSLIQQLFAFEIQLIEIHTVGQIEVIFVIHDNYRN